MTKSRSPRNTNRRTPANMTDRAIAHELDNLAELVAHGLTTDGDRARITDLAEEVAGRLADAHDAMHTVRQYPNDDDPATPNRIARHMGDLEDLLDQANTIEAGAR